MIISILAVFGGLALFITGMNTMSEGLQIAAGSGLRRMLERTTQRRTGGLLFGTALGFLIHSSAATVMLVGFISAGLMTFAQCIPVMLGINVGTTLSMLMVSFRLGDACWIAIAAGLLLKALRPRGRSGAIGLSLFGFGLIFLGMNIMSDAIRPFRGELAPLLAYADGRTIPGMVIGVFISTLITAVVQSSGAVIAMVFAMISAGAIVSLDQAWPIILGANVGTCATALLGSIGSTLEARRSAVSHLVFNLFSAAVGILAAPLIYRTMPLLSPIPPDNVEGMRQALIYQCAIANAIKMAVTALMALPFTYAISGFVDRITPGGKGQTIAPSLLDNDLLDRPEDALQAALKELSRLTGLCRESLRGQSRLYLMWDSRQGAINKSTEEVLDTLKSAMHRYLLTLSEKQLSRRQGILLALLYSGIDHLERMGDHIEHMSALSKARHRNRNARFGEDVIDDLLDLNRHACTVLTRLQQALSPDKGNYGDAADEVIAAGDKFKALADQERAQIAKDVSEQKNRPVSNLYRNEYLSDLSRIVRHAISLANIAKMQEFRIKQSKLGRQMPNQS